MKKLFYAMALLALVVGTVFLTGCKQEEAAPPPEPPQAPATNAPAE